MPRIKALAIGDNRINLISREEVEQADTELSNKIGGLTTLTTTDKNTVVDSINEVNSKRIEYITQDEYNQKVIDDTLEQGITYLIRQANIQPTQAQYNDLLNIIYPVGSIYLSIDDNFIPSTAFGGVWEKIQTGRYLQATDTGAGTEVEESLPNIQGGAGRYVSSGGQFSEGAMWIADGVDLNGYGGSGGYRHYSVRLDASRSSSTYKDGAKVQPDSIKVIMWKRIQ